MNPICLSYAKSTLRDGSTQQQITFTILVENLAYPKEVDVVWAGEDDVWRTLKADYLCPVGPRWELWRAEANFSASSGQALPGNVRCALRYRVSGREYWDNHHHRDYTLEADCGVFVRPGALLLNVDHAKTLQRGQKSYPVHAAVHRSLLPGQVCVHWTSDRWKTTHRALCFFQKDYWHRAQGSETRNPNRHGWEIWTGQVELHDAFRVEYALVCDGAGQKKVWDNNFGVNYRARRERLKVLTLNLHCYQEDRQEEKFSQIARAIHELKIDIVCLQEVGELWNGGRRDWRSNAARILRERLRREYHLSYHLHLDTSHIGFERYIEGSAILSRYKFLCKDSAYVSRSHEIHDIHARRVVMARVHVPYMGLVNVFSAHLSWWEDGFKEQFDNLRKWAHWAHTGDTAATLLCGDFNSKAGSDGYRLIVRSKHYEDQFLKVIAPDLFHRVFHGGNRAPYEELANDHRIDYILMNKNSSLEAVSARSLFTEHDYGRVSDHCGYLLEFEPT